jgi:hypothetical protein
MTNKISIIICLFASLFLITGWPHLINEAHAEIIDEGSPSHKKNTLVISPLLGINHSKLKSSRTPDVTDTQMEYGLFALYASDHVVLNNMLFFTTASNSDISGNFFFANFYGDPEDKYTWNLGGGYLWHEINSEATDVTITVPMAKAGLVRRFKEINFSLNPYIAYAWESVNTTRGDSSSEALLYGISANWRWRMLHLTGKYYLEDKIDSNDYYNVARFRALFSLSEKFGIAARFEYMEHSTIDNTSILIGPAFVF